MRPPVSIAIAAAACAAAAAVATGCGGTTVDADLAAAATVQPLRAETRASAGWDAPPAIPVQEAIPEDFDDPADLATWGYLEGDGGHTAFSVRGGALRVAVPPAAWSGRQRAFFLHRTIQGDFDVRARVRVSAGAALAGVLVRGAPPGGRPGEAWLSLAAGRRVVRLTDTREGTSRTSAAAGRSGWSRLRLRRRADLFEVFVGVPRGDWTQTAAIQREDLPPALQVGVQASGDPRRPGGRVTVDWVRFSS